MISYRLHIYIYTVYSCALWIIWDSSLKNKIVQMVAMNFVTRVSQDRKPATEAALEQAEPTKMAEAGKGESGRSTCSQI